MRRIIAFSVLVMCSLSLTAQVSSTIKDEQRRATYTIILLSPVDSAKRAGCSATAIAPHVLLTAEHCNIENGRLYLNQNEPPLSMGLAVAEKYFDKNDHMLLVVPGVEFKHFVSYKAAKVRKPVQREPIYFYGNPDLIKDQYREGYVSGKFNFPILPEDKIDAAGTFAVLAVPVVGGDSGSAVFSGVDGQLIGVTTWGMFEGKFLGTYPLQFTQEQIDQATGNGNFVYLPGKNPASLLPTSSPRIVVIKPATDTFLRSLFAMFLVCFAFANFGSAIRKTFHAVGKGLKFLFTLRIIRKKA